MTCRCGMELPLEDSPFTGQPRCPVCRAWEDNEDWHSRSAIYVSLDKAQECSECGLHVRHEHGDYICWRCRREGR